MSQGEVIGIFMQTLITAAKISGPLLIVSIVLGLVIAIFQAATQIQEQTLSFVPKILAITLLLIGLGSWMMTTLIEFTKYAFTYYL
ncbi:MAG: flagellar biosynthetic protein FliQ [Oscillospiraceae bacterium]